MALVGLTLHQVRQLLPHLVLQVVVRPMVCQIGKQVVHLSLIVNSLLSILPLLLLTLPLLLLLLLILLVRLHLLSLVLLLPLFLPTLFSFKFSL